MSLLGKFDIIFACLTFLPEFINIIIILALDIFNKSIRSKQIETKVT